VLEADRVLRGGAPLISFASRRYLDILMGAVRRVRGDEPGQPLQTGTWVHRQGHPLGVPGFLRPEHEPFIISGYVRAMDDDVRATRSYLSPHNASRKPTRRTIASRGYKAITYTPHEVGPMGGTVIECARNKPQERVGHPTQKPLAVMEYLVLLACPPGGLVVDPFCGSGTTVQAAAMHGRRGLGFDVDLQYVEMARRRIAGPLFAAAEPSAREGA
jgi:hypothetical protein